MRENMNDQKPYMQGAWFTLTVLFLINTVNFFDRLVIGAVGEPIRKEFELGDSELGLLSTAFVLLYAVVGIPMGRLADTASRKKILAVSVFFWSLFTFGSGLARNFFQIFLLRLGVGIGEAACAPAATSLISDIFPPEKRARAMSIFMLGLPVGIALGFYLSGVIAREYGWRYAFFAAGLPGLFLAALALLIREPKRSTEPSGGIKLFEAASYKAILSSRTVQWLILSGAVHNFTMYTLSFFITPYLMRYHEMDIRDANIVSMLVNGIFTLPGLLLGGFAGDIARKWRIDGGLLIVAGAILVSAPLFLIGILAEAGDTFTFTFAMGTAFALMYFYYSVTYASISEVVPAEVRGTAMAVYFLAMYVLGGAFGPFLVGALSDHFTRRAATCSGVTDMAAASLEPFRASGLQSAMLIVPILCVVLSLIMFMAARSFKDHRD